MKQFFKQFMESGIRSFPNIFFTARVKLTLIYVCTTMLVILFFSVGLFEITSRNIRIGRPPRPQISNTIILENKEIEISERAPFPRRDPIVEQEIRKELIQDIKENIIVIDLILLCITTLVGYMLSGITLRPIRESYDRQKKFIADASHDLRTPLAIMHSEMEVALMDKKSDHVDVIKSNLEEVEHMTKLVDNLFFLAKMDQGEKTPFESIDVGELLSKVVHTMTPLVHKKGLNIIHTIEPGTVLGNGMQLERVFRNIITNALQYTNVGNITISGKHSASSYVVTVADTGVGILQKDLPHVFDRFYKGDNSRTDSARSGLGLSIAREIVQVHHGHIEVTSTVEKGTEVIIRLPIKK